MESFPFKNGYWIWDDDNNTVNFVSNTLGLAEDSVSAIVPQSQRYKIQTLNSSIKFKDTFDNMEKIQFRRYFQRHVRPPEPEVITIQDIKDVALFSARRKDLSDEFIKYFHLKQIDRFLRVTILYFQYFLQIWENVLERRQEASRKVTQPPVRILEDIVRDNLSDLRAMMAREYAGIIMGIGTTAKYHHFVTGTTSLSEKDRRLFESLFAMTVRVVWIALQRKQLALIELELNKMMRTENFNRVEHNKTTPTASTWRSPEEDRYLEGNGLIKESKLKQRSALIKELIYGELDFRLLGAGLRQFESKDERSIYLENLFALPDELLFEYGYTIGLIGVPKEEYDCFMMPRERTSRNFDKPIIEPTIFNFPPRTFAKGDELPKQFPTKLCEFHESVYTKKWRSAQCKMWTNYIVYKAKTIVTLDLPTTSDRTSYDDVKNTKSATFSFRPARSNS